MARLTVKGRTAGAGQLRNGRLIVEITRKRGGDLQSCAGAVATSIQESTLVNLGGGDRDSAGLFQQRPSMGWGSWAQVTNPTYAINKFLDQYLVYRKKGYGWLTASHKTQRSAHPSAPARWYGEGMAFAREFAGSGGGSSPSSTGTSSSGNVDSASSPQTETITRTETRVLPYEFSRGDANQRESTWEAARRLADEVQWRWFARGGELWLASDGFLINRAPRARLNEFTPGVVKLSFEYETRSRAAEASLQVISRRYSFLPGDVIELADEGAGSGKWLVISTRRTLHSQLTDLTLQRQRPRLPEPAPQTTTVTVRETRQITTGTSASADPNPPAKSSSPARSPGQSNMGAPLLVTRAYAAANLYSSWRARYDQGARNGLSKGPFRYGDCSSGVSWVLWAAGIPLPGGVRSGWAPSTHAYPGWGRRGAGKYFTVYIKYSGANAHIWIRWNGIGSAWRFDTGGGKAPHQQARPRSAAGFVAHHWPGC